MENNRKRLLLIGGGGHFRSVLDSLRSAGEPYELGLIDPGGQDLPDCPIVGCDDDLPQRFREGWNYAFITVGSVGSTALRRRLFSMVRQIGFQIPNIIDPSAILAKDVILGGGVFVGKRAVINANVTIGQGSIVNTGAIIEHDCLVGEYSHISPGSVLCGGVCLGRDVHVGAGSVIRQQISVGDRCLIGLGSIVVKDIPAQMLAYGTPCEVVKEL